MTVVYGVVYLVENLINNKKYVGQTTSTAEIRFKQHCQQNKKYPITLAIKKYGKENFRLSELSVAFSKEELDEKEVNWIKTLNCRAPNGYNLKDGGASGKMSPQSIAKLSASMMGKNTYKRTDATKELIRQSLGSMRGFNPGKTSSYKGVGWDKSHNKWKVIAYKDARIVFMHRGSSETECARIYDYFSRIHYGEYAHLNLPGNLMTEYEFSKLIELKKSRERKVKKDAKES